MRKGISTLFREEQDVRQLIKQKNVYEYLENAIATVVSTGVLRPCQAVAWASFFNLVAIFDFHLKVAATVGKGIVDPVAVDHYVIFCALIGAIAWNLITYWLGKAVL